MKTTRLMAAAVAALLMASVAGTALATEQNPSMMDQKMMKQTNDGNMPTNYNMPQTMNKPMDQMTWSERRDMKKQQRAMAKQQKMMMKEQAKRDAWAQQQTMMQTGSMKK